MATETSSAPTEADLAAEVVLADITSLTDAIDETKETLDDLYARQKEKFREARGLTPPVTNRRIAEAARISEEAVIQRLRPPKTRAKSARAS